MCLRYAFTTTNFKKLKEHFGLERKTVELVPRYNIAPTQKIPVIFNDDQKTLSESDWGLEAKWHNVGGMSLIFNARSETIDQKPLFKKNFLEKRCLILADAFYEWKKPEKRPFRISLKNNEPFCFAGIYTETEGKRASCMITTSPNDLIARVHNRMPAILPKGLEVSWLDMEEDDAKELLKPYPATLMKMDEISKRINSSKTDSPDLIEPVPKKSTLEDFMQ